MSDEIIININPSASDNIIIDATTSPPENIQITPVLSNIISVNGKTGVVVLNKGDIGLDQVDNTSDLNKPLSNSAISALFLKADLSLLGKYIPLSSVDTQLNINSTNVVQNSAVAKKIQDIENNLNILVDPPTYVQPSATLTTLTTQIEIGTTVNQNITLNWTQGNAGAAYYFRLLRNNVQVQQETTSWVYNVNEVATANTTTFTNVVSYAQGPILNNVLGLPDSRGRIETGSKSINRSFTGYYRIFYGAINSLPASLRNLPKDNHFVTTNAGTTVSMNVSEFGTIDKNIIAIAMPSNRSLLEVITNANETITNNFTVSSVFIPDAAGIPVSYKLYRNTTIVPINIPLLSVKYI